MIDLGFWKRSGALLSLLAHLTLVGAGPLADAYLEIAGIEAAAAGMHVEDESLPPCLKHDHATCIVCRSLQNVATGADESGVARFDVGLRPCIVRPPAPSVRATPWLASIAPRPSPAIAFL